MKISLYEHCHPAPHFSHLKISSNLSSSSLLEISFSRDSFDPQFLHSIIISPICNLSRGFRKIFATIFLISKEVPLRSLVSVLCHKESLTTHRSLPHSTGATGYRVYLCPVRAVSVLPQFLADFFKRFPS